MKSKGKTIVRLNKISKRYILYHQRPTLIESLLSFKKREEIWALKELNLEVRRGEKLGVIGDNGSGKSTLLKIITGITTPTSGSVAVRGKVAALIGLDAGFHPELTGEENIYLSGMLLGMKREEIEKKYAEIVDFSGLANVVDTPLYTYSNGMKLRLGFSIAIYSLPDILLIDEVLGLGDKEFQEKSFRAIKELFAQNKAVIYISHDLESVVRICDRAIWLDKGEIMTSGAAQRVVRKYINS